MNKMPIKKDVFKVLKKEQLQKDELRTTGQAAVLQVRLGLISEIHAVIVLVVKT